MYTNCLYDNLDEELLSLVHYDKKDKSNRSKIIIDLQDNDNHRQFCQEIYDKNGNYHHLPEVDELIIILNEEATHQVIFRIFT